MKLGAEKVASESDQSLCTVHADAWLKRHICTGASVISVSAVRTSHQITQQSLSDVRIVECIL